MFLKANMPFDANIQKALKGHKTKPVQIVDKLTHRELREKNLLSLARTFKPSIPKALKSMTDLLHVADSPGVRMQASKFVIEFYLDVVKSLYKEKYDEQKGDDIQPVLQVYDTSNVEPLPAPEVKEESTNKLLREKQLMQLSRKLKPHVRTAINTVNFLIEDKDTPPAVKYQASKFMIMQSKQLTESIYNDKYDEEIVEEEQEAAPVFSLRMQSVNK